MRVPILTFFKRTLLWLRQIFAILLPATPRRAAPQPTPVMRLPPFGNPYRKTRVSRGTQIWAGIKHVNRSIGLSLQRRYVIITLVIEFVIFCLISSCPRPIIISLRWMIDHLVFNHRIGTGYC